MKVGLLGLQGAFLDHIPHLDRLGVVHSVIRDVHGLAAIDRLVHHSVILPLRGQLP